MALIYACVHAAGRAKRIQKKKKELLLSKLFFSVLLIISLCVGNPKTRKILRSFFNAARMLRIFEKHFAQMAGNAKNTSPTIQNKILVVASSMLVEKIVDEANESFDSVLADESCNISRKEQ